MIEPGEAGPACTAFLLWFDLSVFRFNFHFTNPDGIITIKSNALNGSFRTSLGPDESDYAGGRTL